MESSWNLSQIFENEQAFEKAYQDYKQQTTAIFAFAGKLNKPEEVIKYFRLSEQIDLAGSKLFHYLFLRKSLNGKDIWAIEKISELELFASELETKTVGLSQELKKNSKQALESWKSLPEFADYDLDLDYIIRCKKHMISAVQEKMFIKMSDAMCASELFNTLDNVELKFGKIKDENGKLVELTHGNYSKFVRSTNRNVRKQASAKIKKAYAALNQTIAVNYISHLKFADFVAKTYKYASTLDSKLEASELPKNLPQSVVKNVNKFLPLLDRYYAWRKKYMGFDKMYGYDLACEVVESKHNYFELEKGVETIKKALLPLGADYAEHLDRAIDANWFDRRILPAKESGGYCLDVQTVHPFILTNYNGTRDCVSTLAHEFGHAMHFYYTDKTQPLAKSHIGIFLAEIASTVNEVLLSHYFIEHAKTKEEKISAITSFLTTFIGTVFTQTQYTEFELFVHDKINNNLPLTYKMMNDFYKGVINKYYGNHVEHTNCGISWSRIPHFYSDFYVFKYVTGFISACAIAQKLLSEPDYAKTYRKFLSGGSSKKPCELLKDAGVDILDKKTFDEAFLMFEEYVNKLEKLTK